MSAIHVAKHQQTKLFTSLIDVVNLKNFDKWLNFVAAWMQSTTCLQDAKVCKYWNEYGKERIYIY